MDPRPTSTSLDGSTANSDQPLPDKRLAARECVDILEEIAVLLVCLDFSFCSPALERCPVRVGVEEEGGTEGSGYEGVGQIRVGGERGSGGRR